MFGRLLLKDTTGVRVNLLIHEHRPVVSEIIQAIFEEWLRGTGRQPVTWLTLVEVLSDPEIELDTLAGYIRDEKC